MRARAGHTLIEVLLVTILIGLLTATGVPSYVRAVEQAKADEAAIVLRRIWLAQRMHRLETGTFTNGLGHLVDLGVLDQAVVDAREPYTFSLVTPDLDSFTASATRDGSAAWSGAITVDESGTFDGQITSGATSVSPRTFD